MKSFLIVLFLFCPFTALAQDASWIIQRVEDNLNGKTLFMQFTMSVTTKRATRTMEMKSWSEGNSKSFIRILYPKKDKGITFLKMNNSMWQYVPRIEKIMKIPASMMLQSWMGSDFTNDDLVKESSMSRDYNVTLLKQTADLLTLALVPKEDAPVVWSKIIMEVSVRWYLPTIMTYFDEDGEKVRILEYLDVQSFGDREYPVRWVVTPTIESKQGHKTVIEVTKAVFDQPIDAGRFSKRALKRYSRQVK